MVLSWTILAVCKPLLDPYLDDSAEAIAFGMIRFAVCNPIYFMIGLQDVITGVLRGYGHSAAPMIIVLFLSWNPPHSPYDQIPQRYLDMYPDVKLKENVVPGKIVHHTGQPAVDTEDALRLSTRQYYAAVSGLDEQFGRIITKLTFYTVNFTHTVSLYQQHIIT